MTTAYRVVGPREGASWLRGLGAGEFLAVDLETTGLDPRANRARLVGCQPFSYRREAADPVTLIDLDQAAHPDEIDAVWSALVSHVLVAHNAQFDLPFPLVAGHFPRLAYCTMLMAQQTLAGEQGKAYGVFKSPNLFNCAAYFLGVPPGDDRQLSNWGAPALTPEQLAYAAHDVALLPQLFNALVPRLADQAQHASAMIERRALPALAWLAAMGAPFSPELWAVPYRQAQITREELFRRLRADWLTDDIVNRVARGQTHFDFFNDSRADKVLGSPAQVKQFLAEVLGYTLTSTDDDHLASLTHPVGQLLRDYRQFATITKMFSDNWGRKPRPKTVAQQLAAAGLVDPVPVRNGRIYPRVHQYGAETGRMSYAYPNIQQVPNPATHPLGKQFRAAFRAPEGRRLVIADFSQIELRIAAEVSGDARMKATYAENGDIHTEAARWVLGVQEPTKADRQIMKSANFGLLYGAGVETFQRYALSSFGLRFTLERAAEIREGWFQAFPGIRAWHRRVGNELDRAGRRGLDCRSLSGRLRQEITRYSEALNHPVQASGADMLKLALARIYEDRHNAPCPPSGNYTSGAWWPVLVVHDEIVLEVPEEAAEAMGVWLRGHMASAGDSIMESVPCDATVHISEDWSK